MKRWHQEHFADCLHLSCGYLTLQVASSVVAVEMGNLEAECGLLMMVWWIAHFSTWSNTFPREDLCKYFTKRGWGTPGFLGSFRARGEGLDGIQAQSSGNQDCIQLGKRVHLYHFSRFSICALIYDVYFSLWLTSLCVTVSRSIHVCATGTT